MGNEAAVDILFNGRAYGNVAQRMLGNSLDLSAIRQNATSLRKDEWKAIDDAIVAISRVRLIGVDDLVSRGLVYNIPNGLGTTSLEVENISDMNEATINMAGEAVGENDAVQFDLVKLPLPIVHKDFTIPIRKLHASRERGQPLDVLQAQVAAIKVAEKIEEILFTGASAYTFAGGVLRGYTDHPNRVSASLTQNWDSSAGNGEIILDDVNTMIQASVDAKHYGPWIMYIPTAYQRTLSEDYKSSSDKSVLSRLMELPGLLDVKVADKLTANEVVLVEMLPTSVRMVIGMQPQTIEWESQGGMVLHFRVMAIMVPQILADQDGNTGIVHAT